MTLTYVALKRMLSITDISRSEYAKLLHNVTSYCTIQSQMAWQKY